MAMMLPGKPVAVALQNEIVQQVDTWKSQGVKPRMMTLLVGSDSASTVYAEQKGRWARRLGISFEVVRLPADTSQSELERRVQQYSADESVHGIMVELPLPDTINKQKVVAAIHAMKDVDGMSPCHSFAQPSPQSALYPATPLACIRLLKHYRYDLKGTNVSVIGCGQTVGLPLIHLLIFEGATVSACHEYTQDVRARLQQSEIAFVAVGKPGLIHPEMVHDNLTVIDVGITQTESGEVLGDLAPEAAALTQAYTPTPGGVGAVTTMQIFANLMHAMDLQRQHQII